MTEKDLAHQMLGADAADKTSGQNLEKGMAQNKPASRNREMDENQSVGIIMEAFLKFKNDKNKHKVSLCTRVVMF